jgi:hypothetical protein
VTNNTVNNETVNNVTGALPGFGAVPGLGAFPLPATPLLPGAAGAGTLDICVNWPGSQPSVPAGLVLTFARDGGLVCVTPGVARTLNPAAVSVKVPAGGKLVLAKRGGLLCVGPAGKKRLTVPKTMTAAKVFALARSGQLVCLKP